MKKQKIANILIMVILCMSPLMFLPWVYMTVAYYIARYVIMLLTLVVFALTFSLNRMLSARFVRLLILAVLCMLPCVLFLPIDLTDIFQLVVSLITITVGAGLQWDERQWMNACYYYTICVVTVILCNAIFYAGGLYVPEYYMFDEGKNQIGAMAAIGATACFYFGMKMRDERTSLWVISFLALLSLVLIRARSDVFALIACGLLIVAKEADFKWKWNVKTFLTIIGFVMIGVIIYTGFISEELHTFMFGGKSGNDINDITTNRWARNQQGLDIFIHHHSMNDLKNPMKIPFIHNYPLLRLARYGFFSIPLLAFYLYFCISALIEIFKTRKSQIRQAGWIVCCIPLIISLAEPNFPYGPGLVQLLAFLLLGFSLSSCEKVQLCEADGKTKKVLHSCNDFFYSKVHANLYRELDGLEQDQVVFTPVRKTTPENNRFDGQHTTFIYAHILKPFHRLFFFHKVDRTVREIEKTVDLGEISCIHATTLFSDGMVARELHRKYGIPYIVAVRNCDVNAFLRYMPHLWWVHRAVLESAGKVVFITPNLRQRLLKHPTLWGMKAVTADKSIVIPNGINDFWINHLHTEKNTENPHRLLYVGIFNRNKNIPRMMRALQSLRSEIPDLHLDVAGDGGDNEQQVLALMKQHADWITYHGRITDLEEMRSLYRANSVFVMPSKSETFGLVYVEALSQGLSVLWSRGEAIEGMFSEPVGESVNPLSENDIAAAMRKLLQHPEAYETLPESTFNTFRWHSIAQHYVSLYDNLHEITNQKS